MEILSYHNDSVFSYVTLQNPMFAKTTSFSVLIAYAYMAWQHDLIGDIFWVLNYANLACIPLNLWSLHAITGQILGKKTLNKGVPRILCNRCFLCTSLFTAMMPCGEDDKTLSTERLSQRRQKTQDARPSPDPRKDLYWSFMQCVWSRNIHVYHTKSSLFITKPLQLSWTPGDVDRTMHSDIICLMEDLQKKTQGDLSCWNHGSNLGLSGNWDSGAAERRMNRGGVVECKR